MIKGHATRRKRRTRRQRLLAPARRKRRIVPALQNALHIELSLPMPQPWGDYPVAFGGESESELQSRMVAALSRIMARPQRDCVLAVSHGSACQEFLEYVTGEGELPDNGAVLHFGYCDGAFSLLDW